MNQAYPLKEPGCHLSNWICSMIIPVYDSPLKRHAPRTYAVQPGDQLRGRREFGRAMFLLYYTVSRFGLVPQRAQAGCSIKLHSSAHEQRRATMRGGCSGRCSAGRSISFSMSTSCPTRSQNFDFSTTQILSAIAASFSDGFSLYEKRLSR